MQIEDTILIATVPTGLLGHYVDSVLESALPNNKPTRFATCARRHYSPGDRHSLGDRFHGHHFLAEIYSSFKALMKSAELKVAVLCAKSGTHLNGDTVDLREIQHEVSVDSKENRSAELRDQTSNHKNYLMEQKDHFPDRDTLLAELHHRVRNNLQIIISALNLQLRELRSEEAIAALQESINRITSFSLIQNLCYDAPDAGRIDFGAHLAELRKQGLKAGERPLGLSLIIEGPKLILPLAQAIPCSMAISELIFASYKYEQQSQTSDRYDSVIYLDFTQGKDSFQICLRGKPIHRVIKLNDSNCLELRLGKALIGQLSGQIRFQPDCNNHSLSRVLIDGPLVR